MWSFFFGILIFVILLTMVVRLGNMKVRKAISEEMNIGLIWTFVGLVLVSWWFVTRGETVESRILVPLILPSPIEVLQAFPKLHFEQGLVRSVWISFQRIATGFSLAVLASFFLGVYMAAFTQMASFFKPLKLVGSYVPLISFIPLTMAWWGGSEMQKVGFIFITCFVVLLPLVIRSIDNVDNSYLDVAKTKGASQWQLVKNVLVPVAMPDIWGHFRGVYGVGWGWIIMAEVVNGQEGIGYLMSISERRGHTASIFAIIVVIVLVATLCDKIWQSVGDKFFPNNKES